MSKNRINPKKLKQSKWTAVQPRNKEKHFLVTDVLYDEDELPTACKLVAVISNREYELDWRELKDAEQWLMGWQ